MIIKKFNVSGKMQNTELTSLGVLAVWH